MITIKEILFWIILFNAAFYVASTCAMITNSPENQRVWIFKKPFLAIQGVCVVIILTLSIGLFIGQNSAKAGYKEVTITLYEKIK